MIQVKFCKGSDAKIKESTPIPGMIYFADDSKSIYLGENNTNGGEGGKLVRYTPKNHDISSLFELLNDIEPVAQDEDGLILRLEKTLTQDEYASLSWLVDGSVNLQDNFILDGTTRLCVTSIYIEETIGTIVAQSDSSIIVVTLEPAKLTVDMHDSNSITIMQIINDKLRAINDKLQTITGVSEIKGTYDQIKNYADTGKLTLWTKYIITDYYGTINKSWQDLVSSGYIKTAGHQFYIVLTPISATEFSEDASCRLVDDTTSEHYTYFQYDHLEKYKIKFDFENKCITYMMDSSKNEGYLDFKNTLFSLNMIQMIESMINETNIISTAITAYNKSEWFYLCDSVDNFATGPYDNSVNRSANSTHAQTENCKLSYYSFALSNSSNISSDSLYLAYNARDVKIIGDDQDTICMKNIFDAIIYNPKTCVLDNCKALDHNITFEVRNVYKSTFSNINCNCISSIAGSTITNVTADQISNLVGANITSNINGPKVELDSSISGSTLTIPSDLSDNTIVYKENNEIKYKNKFYNCWEEYA